MSNAIHNISRAIIKCGEYVLLTHPYGKDFVYLPGGHIEENETALQALERELQEELSIDFNELKFQGICGILEASFPRSIGEACHYHEINFIYLYEISETKEIPSKEHREDFLWHHVCTLNELPLLPSSLKQYIPQWIKGSTHIDMIHEMATHCL